MLIAIMSKRACLWLMDIGPTSTGVYYDVIYKTFALKYLLGVLDTSEDVYITVIHIN